MTTIWTILGIGLLIDIIHIARRGFWSRSLYRILVVFLGLFLLILTLAVLLVLLFDGSTYD